MASATRETPECAKHRPMVRVTRISEGQSVDGFFTWSTSCLDCGKWYSITAPVEANAQ